MNDYKPEFSGWTPLFSSIVDSSVWCLGKDVKLLWITMLAKKNRNGIVNASLPGLARDAGLTLAECEAALKVLESPDKLSRSPMFDGRRIRPVDGGWKVLNHEVYRKLITEQARKDYKADWARRKRGVPLPGEAAYVAALKSGDEAKAEKILERQP